MEAPTLHHLGLSVTDEESTLDLFQRSLKFTLVAKKCSREDRRWVFRRNGLTFVVIKALTCQDNNDHLGLGASTSTSTAVVGSSCDCDTHNSTEHLGDLERIPGSSENTLSQIIDTAASFDIDNLSSIGDRHFTGEWSSKISSVHEVCFEVGDVARSVERAQSIGAKVLRPCSTVVDANGSVTYATIRSCVGNVQHTLVNTTKYEGQFLPTYTDITYEDNNIEDPETGQFILDHITFCVDIGNTVETIEWYEKCFSMHRLLVNKYEDRAGGLTLNEIGLRMAAMEYWHCAETGISLTPHHESVKFVVAESLTSKPNQVNTFLRQHGGPGIQHIGLHTDRLVDCVGYLKRAGINFLQPPPTYYEEVSKLKEITDCGESVELMQDYGILLDSEADCAIEKSPGTKYLMQIFTRPIFGDDTFFLEFLQRHGAHGFGAGNITALWKAVELYMSRQNHSSQA